jgi:hypothetical protein
LTPAHLCLLADAYDARSVSVGADGVTFDTTWIEAAKGLRTMVAVWLLCAYAERLKGGRRRRVSGLN